jgi:membrane protein DedA with SNARE-associated domain
MHWFYHVIRHALVHWGYWAVLAGLIGEDAGLPVPGETILIFASFLSHKHTGLRLQWVIAVGIGACITGDNLGFLLGHRLGSRLLRWAR